MFRITQIATAAALIGLSSLSLAADPIKIGVAGPFTGGSSRSVRRRWRFG